MKCPLEGTIKAYLDEELPPNENSEIQMHIDLCEDCRNVFLRLKEETDFAEMKITGYRKSVDDISPVKGSSFYSVSIKNNYLNRRGVINYMIKYKKIAAAACAVVLLSACITVQPVRAAISNALSVFRVENVKSINISMDDLSKIQKQLNQHKSEISLDSLGKIRNTGGEMKEISLPELNRISDFKVSVPSNIQGSPSIYTTEPAKIGFNLDTSKMNELIKSLGGARLLPDNLNNKNFSINIARTVNLKYTVNNSKINIIETTTPELIAPQDVNVDEIYNALVELPVIPENLQKQLRSIKDWKNTAYLPVSPSLLTEVDLNGVKGYAGTYAQGKNKNNTSINFIILHKDGVFYEVETTGDKSQLIDIVKSMR